MPFNVLYQFYPGMLSAQLVGRLLPEIQHSDNIRLGLKQVEFFIFLSGICWDSATRKGSSRTLWWPKALKTLSWTTRCRPTTACTRLGALSSTALKATSLPSLPWSSPLTIATSSPAATSSSPLTWSPAISLARSIDQAVWMNCFAGLPQGGRPDDWAWIESWQQVCCGLHQQQPDYPPQHSHQRVHHHPKLLEQHTNGPGIRFLGCM